MFLGIVCVILMVTAILQWHNGRQAQRTLLTETEGLVIFERETELNQSVQLPTETFGADIYTSGLYTTTTSQRTQGTVVVVYTKNNWRFIEISYLPYQDAQTYLQSQFYLTTESVKLTQETEGWLALTDRNPRCIDYQDEVPNRCEISRHLLFNTPTRMILIAADGHHATDGELVAIAQSILQNTDN